LKERSAELQLRDTGRQSEWHRHKFDFVHAIDFDERQIEDRIAPSILTVTLSVS